MSVIPSTIATSMPRSRSRSSSAWVNSCINVAARRSCPIAGRRIIVGIGVMNLPNILTIARIFFVPLLVAALVEETVTVRVFSVTITNEWLALAIFLIAAVTDLLDGYLARRWGQVTTSGTLLDPIADKLLISAALISLVQVRAVPGWMVILIVGREFAISGLRSI